MQQWTSGSPPLKRAQAKSNISKFGCTLLRNLAKSDISEPFNIEQIDCVHFES